MILDIIKSKMDRYAMTHAEMAERTGISRSVVTHYLSGRRNAPATAIDKMVAALECDIYLIPKRQTELLDGSAAERKNDSVPSQG